MSSTVLIACDKFKGTLTAAEACEAVAAGLREILPEVKLVSRPVADGGEGTARVVCEALNGQWLTTEVSGPLGERVTAGYAWLPETRVAVIEMNEASGLKLVPPAKRNPWRSNTAGTGELMLHAMKRGAERIIVGIGGSATNDGGAGMAWALGYRFYNEAGESIAPVPANMLEIRRIERPENLKMPEVVAACDVTNPLLGPEGATPVYGPQKGVRLDRVPHFEAALSHLADLVKRDIGTDCRDNPGAGAAGGLGFGLMSFCNARTQPGFDLVAEVTGLESAVREADLVVTGEGCLDAQTLHGKGPAGVADLARAHRKPVAAVGGMVDEQALTGLRARFDIVISVCSPDRLQEAIQRPVEFIKAAVINRGEDFKTLLRG